MIFEYALSPNLCTVYEGNMQLFLESFGFSKGKLISDIPKEEWKTLSYLAIDNAECRTLEKKTLKLAVDKLIRTAMISRHSTPKIKNGSSWLSHALSAHQQRKFRAIIYEEPVENESCVLVMDHDLIDNDLWSIPLDVDVQRKAFDMLDCIKPMLDCAKEIILIDRNFDPKIYRWSPFLIELAKYAKNREFNSSIKEIDYHIGDNFGINHIEDEFKKKISPDMPAGVHVNFFTWPNDKLHDRFILTDLGGVNVGIGLDINDGSRGAQEEASFRRISREVWKKWYDKCKSVKDADSRRKECC